MAQDMTAAAGNHTASLDLERVILPEPVALEGRLDYRCEQPVVFLVSIRENRREPYQLEHQRATTVIITGKGPYTFFGNLPPEVLGHQVSFYSMNRSMAGTRSTLQTLKDLDTGATYAGGFKLSFMKIQYSK